MSKKIVFLFFILTLTTICYAQEEDAGKGWIGGGFFYNNHSPDTFDGQSFYSSDDASFYAPQWENAPGYFITGGVLIKSSGSSLEFGNSITYQRAFHSGIHTDGSLDGIFNEVMLSMAWSFFEIVDMFQPYISAGLSWSWMSVENGVILSDGSRLKAVYPGLGIHMGAGMFIELFDFILMDISGGYRILDYLSGTYDGFSRHFEGIGNGWYIKLGTNVIVK